MCVLCVQAQKELLDAELDLYKKTQSGEDMALLKIKYTQLQIEVQILFLRGNSLLKIVIKQGSSARILTLGHPEWFLLMQRKGVQHISVNNWYGSINP